MNTTKDDDFDYQSYLRENPPDSSKIHRGTDARKQRFEAAMMKFAVRIDENILRQFQQLVPQGQSYDRLINQALQEWLLTRDVKEVVRSELHQALQQAISSIQTRVEQPESKMEIPLAVEKA